MGNHSLNNLLKNLENLYPKYIDLSLDRIEILLNKLNNPHLNLPPTIHIAGTNGKGSVCNFIYQILKECKYKVHVYTSPHLESLEERYIIRNKQITNKKLFDILLYIKKINNDAPITLFEILTVAGFYLFNKNKADFLILETGLGGTYDATNIISESLIDIITPIDFDHQEFLGKSIKKITREKLGIIKPSSKIIISKQKKEVLEYIKNKLIKEKNKKIFYNINYKIMTFNKNKFTLILNKKLFKFNIPRLIGNHQIENASTAVVAALELKKLGYNINYHLINKGIKNTKWPGRLEKFKFNKILLYLDGAHNISGARSIVSFISNSNKETWVVLGMLKNKNLEDFLKTLKGKIKGVMAIKIPNEKNSFSTQDIFLQCNKIGIKCFKIKNVNSLKKAIINEISAKQIVVTGSLYLIGKLRKLFI